LKGLVQRVGQAAVELEGERVAQLAIGTLAADTRRMSWDSAHRKDSAVQQKIIPNLWFDTEAEEAADLYTSVFKNSRVVNVAHYTEAGPRPAGTVMTVEFELDGQRFVGINGGPQFTFDEAVSFQIDCETQDEIDHYWERLSEGGEEGQCGWLKDRYGLSWQVVPTGMEELFADPDPERARRAMQAMLGMGKIDIAALRSAAKGDSA
jgi:predicted 3-demethylubiquinone-9 3-methyltransferase (glyoxalase superfamily)